jgi:2-methylcitrate dehydratase PrpD
LAVTDIRRVQVIGHSHIRPWCEPLEERRRPRNAAAAANSVLFGVAKALCNGDVMLRDFTAAGLSDPRAAGVADLTIYALDDRVAGGMVRVEMKDGRVMQSHVEIPLGHPSRPLPDERLRAKFADCCSYAATPLRRERVDELLRLIEHLDETDDVGALAAMAGGV